MPAFIPEICLLTNARRTASITAKTLCDIFILHAEDFREVVDEYPEMRQVMESVASQRLSRMGKSVDFSSCPSKELLLARLQSSRASSICGSCSNLLQPREYNPEIVITRDFKTDCDMSDNEVTWKDCFKTSIQFLKAVFLLEKKMCFSATFFRRFERCRNIFKLEYRLSLMSVKHGLCKWLQLNVGGMSFFSPIELLMNRKGSFVFSRQ